MWDPKASERSFFDNLPGAYRHLDLSGLNCVAAAIEAAMAAQIGHIIEALPVAARAEFFQSRVDIADPQELYTFLATGQSLIFNALSPEAKGETLLYMFGGQDGTSTLENAVVNEYAYFVQPVSEEVQVANGVWIAAPTVQRGGIDTIVVCVEGNADVPAGYYSVGLVEENEILISG